jgi:chaperonin cofactor prefoldin
MAARTHRCVTITQQSVLQQPDDWRRTAGAVIIGPMASPGDVLVDRYELQSQLGRGGMAEVFRAHDRRLDREVAVKVLAPHLLADARSVERFDREARAAASLNHPNIVNVYDAINEGDTHAIVMELIEGPTLADVIAQEGQMAPDAAVRTAIGIADALQAAHDRGLVHHDVKPRNVLFDSDGKLKVADFGIARAASSDITTVQGSPPYLAPEQARGGRSDRRSDIYALGCVLFEMLAGRPPFEGDSSSAVIMQHIDSPVPRLSVLRSDIPGDLETIVERALAKEPAERYESPAAMRADLTRVAEGLAVAGATIVSTSGAMPQDATMALDDEWDEPPPVYDTEDEPPRRRRGISARSIAIALAAILLIAVLALAWADSQGQPTVASDPATEEPAEPAPEQPDSPQGGGANGGGNGGGGGGNTGDDGDAQGLLDRLGEQADRLEGLLEAGREADEATAERIEELRGELEQAIDNVQQSGNGSGGGDSGAEDSRLDELQRRIDQLAEDQEATQNLLQQLQELISNLNPFGGNG